MQLNTAHLIRGILLVAGTTIGGGMLALPVLTGLGGFFPSLIIYLLCWLFMASAGLLFIEISAWAGKDANIISMARLTLGKRGEIAAWIVYLFLFYCLTLAYVVGCGNLAAELSGGRLTDWQGSLLFVALFAPFIYAGARVVGHLNTWLMAGLGVSYAAFIGLGYSFIRPALLMHRDWSLSLNALPIAFTAFAYQGIIPTLIHYMQGDVKRSRIAVLVGSFIPLIAYVIWQGLILGIIPVHGAGGLEEALQQGKNAIYPLKNFISSPWLYAVGQAFAFFALVTSFFGVTLGLLDFLADGLQTKKEGLSRLGLSLLIFAPTLAISFTYPDIFLTALDYAGGFGCAFLLGLLPILMVWRGRYCLGLRAPYQLAGGKKTLFCLAFFALFELAFEGFQTWQKWRA